MWIFLKFIRAQKYRLIEVLHTLHIYLSRVTFTLKEITVFTYLLGLNASSWTKGFRLNLKRQCVFLFPDKLLTFPLYECRISLHGERYGGLQVRSGDHPAQLCILEININKLCKSILKWNMWPKPSTSPALLLSNKVN